MVAADSLIRFVKRESGYVYSDELSLPHLGACFCKRTVSDIVGRVVTCLYMSSVR